MRVNQRLSLTNTFNHIYAEGIWGRDDTGKGTSGSGSTLEITREYRAYVEDFMKKHAVKSVVDAGCGDWSFSSAMDWGDASYLGVDIASDIVEADRKKYERDKIKFQVGDITEELPAADLLISKDVLQHLSNGLVQKFIENNLKKGKYKWVILTNDRGSGNPTSRAGDTERLTSPPLRSRSEGSSTFRSRSERRPPRSPRSSTSRSSLSATVKRRGPSAPSAPSPSSLRNME